MDTRSLKIGDFAPDFILDADDGRSITLSELRGKMVVLYFYPKDNTSGCTKENIEFSLLKDSFEYDDVLLFGISRDSIKTHCNFKEKYDLYVHLLSDTMGSVCDAYGVLVEKNMYGKKHIGIERSTFLINSNGTIRKIWRKVKVDGHAAKVYEEIT